MQLILWVKAFHVVAMVAWYAGIFYLPRLFVYHAMCPAEDVLGTERLKTMERKLFKAIMTPAAVVTTALGTWLIFLYGGASYLGASGWLHAKLALVGILIGYHGYSYKLLLDFRHDRNRHSHKFYRAFNEVPTLILIAVVVLVIVKPF